MNSLRIIDLSSNNPPPYDFARARAAGISGVVVKLSEGAGYRNPYFSDTWAAIKAAGLWRGVYHFGRPDAGPAQQEAAFFLSQVPPLEPGDAVALDLETGAGDLSAWALAWLRPVKAALGFAPMLYSYAAFIEAHLTDPQLATHNLWLADYGNLPSAIGPWAVVALWQHTDRASVDGIAGLVDESLIARDLAGLAALGKPAPSRPAQVIGHCALKPLPGDHFSAALAQIPAGASVVDYGPTAGGWERVRYNGVLGAVLASNLRAPQ